MEKRPVLFTSSIISRVLKPIDNFRCALVQAFAYTDACVEEIRRKALAKCRIGLVTLRAIPYGHVTELKRLLPEADLVEFGLLFNRIRRVRSEEEFRRSGFLTDLACIALEQRLHPGMNEQEIVAGHL